jgi:hypothetical protein
MKCEGFEKKGTDMKERERERERERKERERGGGREGEVKDVINKVGWYGSIRNPMEIRFGGI